jgi:hypothetical protein
MNVASHRPASKAECLGGVVVVDRTDCVARDIDRTADRTGQHVAPLDDGESVCRHFILP